MNEKSKGRAVPSNLSPAVLRMADIAGAMAGVSEMSGGLEPAQRMAGQMAQLSGIDATSHRLAEHSAALTGSLASAGDILAAGSLASLGEMLGDQAALTGSLASAGDILAAGSLASLGEMLGDQATLRGSLAGLGEMLADSTALTGNLASASRLLAQASGMTDTVGSATGWMENVPLPDVSWTRNLTPALSTLGLAIDSLPSPWWGQDMGKVLEPLLETMDFRPFGGAAGALADWAEDRLSGIETASPQRFEEIAEALAGVELDEESERQFEHLLGDEAALKSVATYWGLEKLSLTKRETVVAISILAGFTSFLLLIVGLVAAPALTGIITGSVGGGAAAAKTVHGLLIKYSPEAQAKLDTMKPKDPAVGDGQPET